ncbi:MAG TPA: hypothetical protein VEY09_10400 [Pyrinomonadaceae bacterium]|nr:hypothetical protein [Pyrinomonadaceae bacterium]
MRQRLGYFVASFVLALVAVFAFSAPATVGAQGGSCRTQCRVAYDKCNREASNPGGLNMCKKAFQACLATCN